MLTKSLRGRDFITLRDFSKHEMVTILETALALKTVSDDIDHVKVSTRSNVLAPQGPFLHRKAQTGLQGKFCVSFQMASMIIRRKAGIMEFTDEFVQSPAVQEMMDRVEAVIDPEIDTLGDGKIFSVIEIHLKNRRVVKGKTLEHYRRGPQSPLS